MSKHKSLLSALPPAPLAVAPLPAPVPLPESDEAKREALQKVSAAASHHRGSQRGRKSTADREKLARTCIITMRQQVYDRAIDKLDGEPFSGLVTRLVQLWQEVGCPDVIGWSTTLSPLLVEYRDQNRIEEVARRLLKMWTERGGSSLTVLNDSVFMNPANIASLQEQTELNLLKIVQQQVGLSEDQIKAILDAAAATRPQVAKKNRRKKRTSSSQSTNPEE